MAVNLNAYDSYGFKIESQYISREQWENVREDYKFIEEKQTRKWDKLFKATRNTFPKRSTKMKELIRGGIPRHLRREVWFKYSGAEERMLKHKDLYQALAGREQQLIDRGRRPANEYIDVIERDLNRTFPENIYFKKPPIPNAPPPPYLSTIPLLLSLRRVLVAFSFYSPDIGYCQSMNYIVGLLLLFHSEEETFWMLVVIIEDLLPPNVYTKNLIGTVTEMKVFNEIMKSKCATILHKVQSGGIVELDMLISPWFLTIYINVVPIEVVLRIWDCFFYEGHKILYRMAIAILKLLEEDILKLKEPMDVVQLIQKAPQRMLNVEKLMKTAFQRFGSTAVGHLSHHELESLRYQQYLERSSSSSTNSSSSSSSSSSWSIHSKPPLLSNKRTPSTHEEDQENDDKLTFTTSLNGSVSSYQSLGVPIQATR